MSSNLDQNIDIGTADRLLRKWEQKIVPKELEGLFNLTDARSSKKL